MRIRTIVLTVVVIAVIIGASAYHFGSDPPDITKGDLTVSGDLAHGMVVDEYAGVGTLTYHCDGKVEWHLLDLTLSRYVQDGDGKMSLRGFDTVIEGNVLTLTEPGWYDVRMYEDGRLERSGKVLLSGMSSASFSWEYDGIQHDISFTYPFADYIRYANDPSAVRHASSDLDGSRFASVDAGMAGLEASLKREFTSIYGPVTAASSQNYADFILSFVQSCILQPTPMVSEGGIHHPGEDGEGSMDLFIHGVEEYWAYPLETLRIRMGDVEDTAFLVAALFSAAGFVSAVADTDEGVFAAIGMEVFAPRDVLDMYLTGKHLDSHSVNVFFCTTCTDGHVPAGYMDLDEHLVIMELERVSVVGVGV